MKSIVAKISNPQSLTNDSYCLRLGYPSLSLGALLELESIVNKRQKVLEVGSGGSTIFFAKNCYNLKSFETTPDWYKTVNRNIARMNNVELKLRKNRDILRNIYGEKDNHYDIISINSDPEHSKRLVLANAAVPKLKPGGYLIINNYTAYGMNNFEAPSSWEMRTYNQLSYPGSGTRIYKKV